MGLAVRTVCVACLQSLEISSGGDGFSLGASCPHCGHAVAPPGASSDTPTTGEGLAPPVDPEATTPRDLPPPTPFPSRIGRFLIREPLGEGGYGEVFRAYDPHLDRDVALKVLKPNRLGEKALERFLREARAAARLDHPNIVGLHDAGRDEQRCWIAYQLVPGRTLSALRDVDRPSIEEAARIVRDLALALDHAHRRGVYHRDLKPANVLVDESGRPRLTDFGLARRVDLGSDLTQEGTILGTPQYMSPEAAAGRAHQADGRSDVYSLGVILYELICGRRPADVPSGAPLWRSTRIATPPTPRSVDREIPAALDRISMKALAFDPEARYADAGAFAEALDRFLGRRPASIGNRKSIRTSGRRKRLALGVAAAASALGLLLGLFRVVERPGGPPRPPAAPAGGEVVDGSRTVSPSTWTLPESAPASPTRRVAQRPAFDDRPLDAFWANPVVWIERTRDLKFHLKAGCQHTREIAPARLKDLGDARAAVAAGYSPCKTCLKDLATWLGRTAP